MTSSSPVLQCHGLEQALATPREDSHSGSFTEGNVQSLFGDRAVFDVLKSMRVRDGLVVDEPAPAGADPDARRAVTTLDPFDDAAIHPAGIACAWPESSRILTRLPAA